MHMQASNLLDLDNSGYIIWVILKLARVYNMFPPPFNNIHNLVYEFNFHHLKTIYIQNGYHDISIKIITISACFLSAKVIMAQGMFSFTSVRTMSPWSCNNKIQ